MFIKRPAPFGLTSTDHGTMIVNRNDFKLSEGCTKGIGVGFQLMNASSFDGDVVNMTKDLISSRVRNYGEGVVVVDCGANIGVFTIEWAKYLYGAGQVYAYEAQEKLYYALAGNVILNNCLNVRAIHAAVGNAVGSITIPEPNYCAAGSFGSFELKQREKTEDIGQPIDYATPTLRVPLVTLDSYQYQRLDFLKIDVEGMEAEVLEGALETISRCKPQIFLEVLKSDGNALVEKLRGLGYTRRYQLGMDVLFLHDTDPLKIQMEAPEQVANVH